MSRARELLAVPVTALMAAVAILCVTALLPAGARATSAGCGSYPRPGTAATGATPGDLGAEFGVLERPGVASDRVSLKRLGPLPESGILAAGIRYVGSVPSGGRAYLVPARHLLAAPLAPVACVPKSRRSLQRSLLPSLRYEYAHQGLCLVLVYRTQTNPTCQPAPGSILMLLYGSGSPGFGLAPNGVAAVAVHFRGHPTVRVRVRHNFWVVNEPSLQLAPCGVDWTTANRTVLRTVISCSNVDTD